jgi:hypothetical protein
MLGRLRMSIKDCKVAYINLSERTLTKKSFITQAKEKLLVGPKFRTKPLEAAIKSTVGDSKGSEH